VHDSRHGSKQTQHTAG